MTIRATTVYDQTQPTTLSSSSTSSTTQVDESTGKVDRLRVFFDNLTVNPPEYRSSNFRTEWEVKEFLDSQNNLSAGEMRSVIDRVIQFINNNPYFRNETEKRLGDFYKAQLSEDNIAELLTCALEYESQALVEQAVDYLNNLLPIRFESFTLNQKLGVNILIKKQLSPENYATLKNIIETVSNKLQANRISIELKPINWTSIEDIKKFTEENRPIIIALNLRDIDIDEDTLAFLLKGTRNLKALGIRSNQIEGNGHGLRQLRSLTGLMILELHCNGMTVAPLLDHLKALEFLIFKCPNLEVLPPLTALSNLQRLDLDCLTLKSLPSFKRYPKLKTIHISNCSSLTEGPELVNCPNLVIVSINSCENMRLPPKIINIPNLEILRIQECGAMEKPPEYEHWTSLKCLRISECPRMDQQLCFNILYTFLNSARMGYIITSGGFANFNFPDTTILEPLLAEKKLSLYLSLIDKFNPPNEPFRCQILEKLINQDQTSALKHIFKFNIQNKTLLREILLKVESIQLYVQAKQLPDDIDPHEVIVGYIMDTVIQTNDVSILVSSLSHGLAAYFEARKDEPSTRNFFLSLRNHMSKNTLLFRLLNRLYPPNVPGNSQFYPITGYASEGAVRLHCSLYAPYEQTTSVVDSMTKFICTSLHDILSIQFTIGFYGESGYDAGGLGKQFMNWLFRGLIDRRDSSLPVLLRKRQTNGFHLPIQKRFGDGLSLSGEEIDFYGQLGVIIGFLMRSHRHYPIGEILDPKFFDILVGLHKDDVEMSSHAFQEECKTLDLERLLSISDTIMEHDTQEEKEIQCAKIMLNHEHYIDLPEEVKSEFESLYSINASNFQDTKDIFFKMLQEKYLSTFVAIQAIARGITQCFPMVMRTPDEIFTINDWSDLQQINPNVLAKHIQGEFSKEKLIEAIEVLTDDAVKAAEVKSWFVEWIEGATDAKLHKFLEYLTGSSGLAGKIKVYVSVVHQRFFPHTCFNSLDFPLLSSKDDLFRWLEFEATLEKAASFNQR